MIQASPETREIGVQVDMTMLNHNHSTAGFEDAEMSYDSDIEFDESDIEWILPDQETDDGGLVPDTMKGDTKFIVYKSSLEHLPTHCQNCGVLIRMADYIWNVLGIFMLLQYPYHILSMCTYCASTYSASFSP